MKTEEKKPKLEQLLSDAIIEAFGNEAADKSPDTEGLGYMPFGDRGVIGYVESINGPGAEACWEFQATRHEMQIIAKHWYRELTHIDLLWFLHESTGSTEWRTAIYAERRLERIRERIGETLVDEAMTEVDAELREHLGDAKWEEFIAQR